MERDLIRHRSPAGKDGVGAGRQVRSALLWSWRDDRDDRDTFFRAVVLAALCGLLAIAGILAMVLDLSDDQPVASVGSSGSTTSVPIYDVDEDGVPDFASIEGEIVQVPSRQGDTRLAMWLAFAGTVVAATLAAGSAIVVALVNREGGRKLAALADRVTELEATRPTAQVADSRPYDGAEDESARG